MRPYSGHAVVHALGKRPFSMGQSSSATVAAAAAAAGGWLSRRGESFLLQGVWEGRLPQRGEGLVFAGGARPEAVPVLRCART